MEQNDPANMRDEESEASVMTFVEVKESQFCRTYINLDKVKYVKKNGLTVILVTDDDKEYEVAPETWGLIAKDAKIY